MPFQRSLIEPVQSSPVHYSLLFSPKLILAAFCSTQKLNLFSCFPQGFNILLAGLQQKTNPVCVVVHGEVSQPSTSVGIDNNLISSLDIHDDVLACHAVLVVVLMVLVEDGGNFFSVLADGQEGLLVVVGGNVELEHVGATCWAGEDSSVSVKTSTNVAVSALEGEVFLAATIVGLGSVGVEVNTKGLSVEGLQECIFLHHLSLEIRNVCNPLIILGVRPILEVSDSRFTVGYLLVDSVIEGLVLTVSGSSLSICSGIESSNVSLATIIFRLCEVFKIGNGSFASIIFRLSKVLEVCNFSFAGIIFSLCPSIKSFDFLLPGIVFRVKLSIKLGNVCDPGLVVLGSSFFKRLDFIFPQVVLSGGCNFQGIVVSLQLVVISSKSINLCLAFIIGSEHQSL